MIGVVRAQKGGAKGRIMGRGKGGGGGRRTGGGIGGGDDDDERKTKTKINLCL